MSLSINAIICTCVFVGTHIVVGPSECARILAIETLAGKSHWNVMNSVLRVLVDHGHNVTVFTSFVEGDRDNYTEIDLSNVILPIIDLEYSIVLKILYQVSTYMPMIMDVTRYNCYATYTHKRMQDILAKGNDTEFDLVITEPLASECVSYVAAKLNRPLIYIVPSTQITFIEWEIFGYMSNPAVNSHLMADHAFPKTFMQRLENTILTLYSSYLLKLSEYQMKTQSKQFYDEIDPAKCSLIFSNTHLINESPRSNFANFIQIGGIHLQSPKLLPKDVLEFIEDSPHGVIYFSFGTMIAMSSLPNNTLNIFKEVLSQIPQRVLWKYESEMKDKPVNIMTKTFFPQRDILLHPKVKLFISHGGISGIHETADAGVPVLGFPLFFDQSKNMETLVEAGMAISMDIFTMKKQDLKDAIIKLINNLNYTKNATTVAKIYKDRSMTPAQLVVYWTEYVLRHNDTLHLKCPSFSLVWYQYLLIDVILVIIFSSLIIFHCFIIAYKLIYLTAIRNIRYYVYYANAPKLKLI